MIGSLWMNVTAFLAAVAVLAAGVHVMVAQQDAAAVESLRESAGAIVVAIDAIARRESPGQVLLVGDSGAAPSHFRGSEYSLRFTANEVTLSWRGMTAKAGFARALHPWAATYGLTAKSVAAMDANPLVVGSGLPLWAVRALIEIDGRASWATFLEID